MAHISRHELKSNEFVSGMDAAYEYFLQNRDRIVKIGITALVVIVVGGGVWTWMHVRNAHAQALLAQAEDTLHEPLQTAQAQPGVPTFSTTAARATAAKAQFQQVIDQYGSTSAGKMAQYYLGLTEADLNDPSAEKTLLAAVSSGNDMVSALARIALANYYARSGKMPQALDQLQQLAQANSSALPPAVAWMEMADLQRDSNPAAAAKFYQQIQAQYPGTSTAQAAADALSTLKH